MAALAGRSARAPVPISEASLRNLSLGGIQRLLTKRGVPIPAVEQPFQVYVGIAVANGIAVASTVAAAAAAGEVAAAAAASEVGAAASAADGTTRPQWRLEIAGGKDGLPWRMEVRPPKEDGYSLHSPIIVSPRGPIMTTTAVAVAPGDGGRERGDGSALRRMTLQYR